MVVWVLAVVMAVHQDSLLAAAEAIPRGAVMDVVVRTWGHHEGRRGPEEDIWGHLPEVVVEA